MCGCTGFLTHKASTSAERQRQVMGMAEALQHRGPDDVGVWADDGAGVALGHRRLAILDLSSAGHQPMMSACQRYVIAFNGEIYNHLDLRSKVQGPRAKGGLWQGHSDTETLLAAISCWGLRDTLEVSVGMFAIALWDRQEQTLTLARDRFGEKPLYYGFAQGLGGGNGEPVTGRGPLLFGSELKALMAHPAWRGTLAPDSLEDYLRFGNVGGGGKHLSGRGQAATGESAYGNVGRCSGRCAAGTAALVVGGGGGARGTAGSTP